MKRATMIAIGVAALGALGLYSLSTASAASARLLKLENLPGEMLAGFVSKGGGGDDTTWLAVTDGYVLTTMAFSVGGTSFLSFVNAAFAAGRRVFVSPSPIFDDKNRRRAWSIYLDAPPAGAFGAFSEVSL